MLAIPPAILNLLHLQVGTTLSLTIDHGRLLIEATQRPRYTLGELLAQCDPSAKQEKDPAWLDSAPEGEELL
jgi:antitoxin ChpS